MLAPGVGDLEQPCSVVPGGADQPLVLELGERRVDRPRAGRPPAAAQRLVRLPPLVPAARRWQSGPAGRGRVTERVIAYEPLEGYTVEVEDDSITGEQSVSFEPADDGVEVGLALSYRIKRRSPLTPLIDALFVRRLMVT